MSQKKPDFWKQTKANRPRTARGSHSARYILCDYGCNGVDDNRIFSERFPVEHYQERINESFAENPLHKFVQGLRNFTTHVRIAKSNWVTKWDKEGRSVFLPVQSYGILKKWDGWDAPSRTFIEENLKG